MSWIGRPSSPLVFLLTALLIAGCESPTDVGFRLFGYVDTRGKIVIAPVYEDARPFHDGRAAVKREQGWGFIDAAGHWIVPPRYESAESFSDGRARVRDSLGWGYVDRSGATIIATQFSCESPFFGGHAYVQPAAGPVRLIDGYGHILRTLVDVKLLNCDLEGEDPHSADAPPAWRSIMTAWEESRLEALRKERLYPAELVTEPPSTHKEVAANTGSSSTPPHSPATVVTSSSGKIGYLDSQGHWAVPPIPAKEAGPFVDGLARVERDGKVGFIDRKGQVAVPFRFDDALYRFSHNRTVALSEARAWLIDRNGKRLSDLGAWPWKDLGDDYDQFAALAIYVGLSDFFADGLIPWPEKGKWGYVSLDGKWLERPPTYTSAEPFHDGFANVQIGERWLLIDIKGHPVAEPDVGWVGPRAGPLTRVGTWTRWGFAGADGQSRQTLPFATARITYGATNFVDTQPLKFSEGLAVVSRIVRPAMRLVDERGQTLGKGNFEGLTYVGRDRFVYLDDERWGLLDKHLRIIVPARFESRLSRSESPGADERDRKLIPVTATAFDHDYIFARSNGLGGCINRDGRWAFPPQPLLRARCSGPVIAARASTGWGALGMDGRWRIPPRYDSVHRLDGRLPVFFEVEKDQRSQLVRVTEKTVDYSVPAVMTACGSSSSCLVSSGTQWQRLDPHTLLPTGPKYDEVKWNNVLVDRDASLRGLGVFVRIGQRWGYLAESGVITVPISYDEIVTDIDSADDRLAAAVRRGQEWGVVSLIDGRTLIPVRFDQIKPVGRGYYAVRQGVRWAIMRSGGRQMSPPQFDDVLLGTDGLILARTGGRLALFTVTGEQVLDPPPQWMQHIEKLSRYSVRTWVAYTTDGRVYFVAERTLAVHELRLSQADVSGSRVVSFRSLDGRVARVEYRHASAQEKTGGAVLLDGGGQLVVPEIFEAASWSDRAKRFTVKRGGRCGVIDSRGHWVVPMRDGYCSDIESPPWVILVDEFQ